MTDAARSQQDDWLDALLRQDAGGRDAEVADDGFVARVMTELPPPPAALPAWRKPALAALWAVAGLGLAAALPGAITDAGHQLMGYVASERFTLSQLGVVLVALAAASWAGTVYTLRMD
ncbi:MAG: hypothetical protein ABIS17_02745 [Casimicrobiaceae bacterium]